MQTSQQLDAALNNMAHGISMFDKDQRLVIANKRYAAMYNLSPSQVKPGMLASDILEARVAGGASPASRSFAADRLKEMMVGKDYSTIDYLRDGRVIAINHQRMDNGGWVAVHQDITAQKRVEAELAHMARYDALTGLANRALFLEKVNEALARMASHGEPFSILMLDLDRFKAVNDLLGHAIGDSLLKAVGERLRRLVARPRCRRAARRRRIRDHPDRRHQPARSGDGPRQPDPFGHHRALRHRWTQDRHRHVDRHHARAAGCRRCRCRRRYSRPPCRPRALQVEVRRAQSLSLLPDHHGSGSARPPRARRGHAASPVARGIRAALPDRHRRRPARVLRRRGAGALASPEARPARHPISSSAWPRRAA